MIGSIVCGLIVVACLLGRGLVTGSLQNSTTFTINYTSAPQGNASVSTIPNVQQTITSNSGISLAFGTGSGQANLYVCQDRTLALSTGETLIFYDASLLDVNGAGAAFRHLKYLGIYIVASTGDISGLVIGNAGTDPFVGPLGGTTPTFTIYPNGPPFQIGEPTAGFAITTLLKELLITNGSGLVTVTYRIIAAGTTT